MSLRAAKLHFCLLVGLVGLLAAGSADAQTATCVNDIDCPGTTCGSQTCVHNSGGAMCADANTLYGSGFGDGHCTTVTDCKCGSLGATCETGFCTFTIPPDGGSTGTGAAAAAAD